MKSLLPASFLLLMFAACTINRPLVEKPAQPTPPKLSESLLKKQLDGIDFFARGNIPASWTLEMEFGNLIRFNSLDGTNATSTAVGPQFLPGQNATSFTSKVTNGQITILVYDQACVDGLSGENYDKKVVVTLNNKRFEGCGQYLFDASLNGKWILQKINNKNLAASDFSRGLPIVDLQVQQGKISGHDGCNSINGIFEVLGSKIKFYPLASTKTACPVNRIESDISRKLSDHTVDYYFKDGQLYLYLQDDSILVFSKG